MNLFKRKTVKKLSWNKSLETIVLLSKCLNLYAPILAALGSSDSRAIRLKLLFDLLEKFDSDEGFKKDVYKIVENLLDESKTDLVALFPELVRSWKRNRLDKAVQIGISLGLVTRKDLANMAWVISHFKRGKYG